MKSILNFKICKLGHEYDIAKIQCPICKKDTLLKWRLKNKEYIKEYKKKYNDKNKDSNREYRQKNSQKYRQYRVEYERINSERISLRKKKYFQDNKDRIMKRNNEYMRNRKKKDALFKFKVRMRKTLHNSLCRNNYTKKIKTEIVLGCDLKTAQQYLINTAIKNYGSYNTETTYHIDHIIPLASATTEDEVIKLCHISNLQYLTAEDNLTKSAKIDWKITKSVIE